MQSSLHAVANVCSRAVKAKILVSMAGMFVLGSASFALPPVRSDCKTQWCELLQDVADTSMQRDLGHDVAANMRNDCGEEPPPTMVLFSHGMKRPRLGIEPRACNSASC